MALEFINPKDLPVPQTYTQVVVATGSKMVFVSGQEPEDINGKLVGLGDLATQARQVFSNLGRALAAAGAQPSQVTRITIYVVNYKRDECLPIIEKARVVLFGDHKPADVVLGVASAGGGQHFCSVPVPSLFREGVETAEKRWQPSRTKLQVRYRINY